MRVRVPCTLTGKPSNSGAVRACTLMQYGAQPITCATILGVSISRSIALISSKVI